MSSDKEIDSLNFYYEQSIETKPDRVRDNKHCKLRSRSSHPTHHSKSHRSSSSRGHTNSNHSIQSFSANFIPKPDVNQTFIKLPTSQSYRSSYSSHNSSRNSSRKTLLESTKQLALAKIRSAQTEAKSLLKLKLIEKRKALELEEQRVEIMNSVTNARYEIIEAELTKKYDELYYTKNKLIEKVRNKTVSTIKVLKSNHESVHNSSVQPSPVSNVYSQQVNKSCKQRENEINKEIYLQEQSVSSQICLESCNNRSINQKEYSYTPKMNLGIERIVNSNQSNVSNIKKPSAISDADIEPSTKYNNCEYIEEIKENISVKADHISIIASYEKLLSSSSTNRVTLITENCIMKVIQVYNNDKLQFKPHWYQFTRSDFNHKFEFNFDFDIYCRTRWKPTCCCQFKKFLLKFL